MISGKAPSSGGLRPLLLIYGTALISVMGVASTLPILPDMARVFDLAEPEMGILVISFTLPGIVLAPLGGILADRLSRKAVLIPCLLLFALGGCIAAGAHTLEQFIAGRVVQGSGAACLGVLYNTIIGDIFTEDNMRLRIMGYGATVLSLGAAIFPALGGLMGEVSWRWTLRLSLAALPLAILCLQTPLPRLTRRTALPHYAHQIRNSILQWRCLGHMGITLCAFALLYGPMVTYFPLLAQTRFHVSPAAIGLLFALSSLGTALASSTLGWLNRRLHTRHMVLTGAGLFLLSMLSMLLVTRVWDAFWMCILPIMLYGLGQGLTYPAVMTSLSSLAPCEGRGAIMAVNGTVLRLAQSLSPVLCGLAFTGGAFTGVYILGAGMACVIAGLALLTFPSHRDRIP